MYATTGRVLGLPAFRPVRVALATLVVAVPVTLLVGPYVAGRDHRRWERLRHSGVAVTGTVRSYDADTGEMVVQYAYPQGLPTHTVVGTGDYYLDVGTQTTLLVDPRDPDRAEFADTSLDPPPDDHGWAVALVAAAYGLAALLLYGWLATLARTYRTATWQQWLVTPWAVTSGVGSAARLAFYPVGGEPGARPVRTVTTFWDPGLPDLAPGTEVLVSGDPRTDGVLVVRHGPVTFWPVTVTARSHDVVDGTAPRLGEGSGVGAADPRPGLLRWPGRGLVLALVLGVQLWFTYPPLTLAVLPLLPLAGLFAGYAPRLDDPVRVQVSARGRNLSPSRPPWYLTHRVLYAVTAVLLATGGLLAGLDAWHRHQRAGWTPVLADVVVPDDAYRTDRITATYQVHGRTYRVAMHVRNAYDLSADEQENLLVDPHAPRHAVIDPAHLSGQLPADHNVVPMFAAGTVSALLAMLGTAVTWFGTRRARRRA